MPREIHSNELSNLSFIGDGGFAHVYSAVYRGHPVAVKQIKVITQASRMSFQTETDILMKLSHRNVIGLIGRCFENDKLALVLDLAPFTLEQYWEKLPDPEVPLISLMKWIIYDILRGLEYIHNKGVVHLDLKPSNVLLFGHPEPSTAVLADFGISETITHTTTLVELAASVPFAAPETFLDEENQNPRSPQADIYSLGMIIFFLLAKKNPWSDKSWRQILKIKLQGDQPPVDPNWNPAVSSLMVKCWNENPEERPTSSKLVNWVRDTNWEIEWCCPVHQKEAHSVFISYSQSSDWTNANRILSQLEEKVESALEPPSFFLDTECLGNTHRGPDLWRSLRTSKMELILISKTSIGEIINSAPVMRNDLLSEWETLLSKSTPKLLLFIEDEEGHKFNPSEFSFPDAEHKASHKNIKETLEELFQNEHLHWNPSSNIEPLVVEIMKWIEKTEPFSKCCPFPSSLSDHQAHFSSSAPVSSPIRSYDCAPSHSSISNFRCLPSNLSGHSQIPNEGRSIVPPSDHRIELLKNKYPDLVSTLESPSPYLNLEGMRLDDEQLELVCLFLPSHCLQSIHLGDNGIQAQGCRTLCAALEGNRSLQKLFLGENDIQDSGAIEIARLLRVNNTLKELNLSKNSIGPKGIKEIAWALMVNSSLETLDLGKNSFDLSSGEELLKALQINRTLIKLNWGGWGKYVPGSSRHEIKRLLRRNASLESPSARDRLSSSADSQPRGSGRMHRFTTLWCGEPVYV